MGSQITCHDMMSRKENRNKLMRMKINDAANAVIHEQNIHSNQISAKIMPLHNNRAYCAGLSSYLLRMIIIIFEELELWRKIQFLIGLIWSTIAIGKKELNGAYAIYVSGNEQMIELTHVRCFWVFRTIPKMAFEISSLPRIKWYLLYVTHKLSLLRSGLCIVSIFQFYFFSTMFKMVDKQIDVVRV